MIINETLIGYLARSIAKRVEKAKAIDPDDTPRLEKIVKETIEKSLQLEKEIEEEAHRLLRQHIREIEREGISYRKMFNMVKQKLAKERGLVL